MWKEIMMRRGAQRGRLARVTGTLVGTVLSVICVAATQARQLHLGDVAFPTSAKSAQAQQHFLRGLAALHSFWYPVALAEFRRATAIEPDFMMGYWGEAMAHNHPIWGDLQETDAARKVTAKIEVTAKLTDREGAYLGAVKLLYGDGDKAERDRAYTAAMGSIYHAYPGDAEAALFYALALMDSAAPGPAGVAQRLRAGAIATKVFESKPSHPGAAHYVIHAYDDPRHAHLALAAARRYAEIAPAAPHALHMPSHIFVQLGKWPEAAAANEAAWRASDAWVRQQGLPVSQRDYHSLQWLQYAYLQQGRYQEAERLLETLEKSLAQFPRDDARNLAYGSYTLATMAASYLIETQRWDKADAILGTASPSRKTAPAATGPYAAMAGLAQAPVVFAGGFAAAMRESPDAWQSVRDLQSISENETPTPIPFATELRQAAGIQALEIAAAAEAGNGNIDTAIRTLEKVAAIIDATPPPPGPPPLIKPVHELFGEMLLRSGQPAEAATRFAKSLARHPARARSLLGAAHAAAHSGESQHAVTLYTKFVEQWQQADPQLAEIQDARAYLRHAQIQDHNPAR
jgi:tetratricopeptide (TPR) repeat protein